MISAPLELSDSTDRWQQLQLLRRGRTPVQPWLQQLEQAQAQLAGQGNQTAYTRLLADVSGVVTAVESEVGQVVAKARFRFS